ncbi:hypothetical protein HARCEL1_05530 [Halococcoides cellulosivorans]|uniref:Uncharacterized protein n=2 Tax=Halococcoides cellulosivorans TaxID=1679096 RepID=A0A2R4X065_9EURY|nr:hypothetical protein HARCEL1_05530 [Halococcoides cellulosivorans]
MRSEGRSFSPTFFDEWFASEGSEPEDEKGGNEMRKELDLDMDERIRVEIGVEDRVAAFVDEHRDLIAEEVRADAFEAVEDGLRETWEIEDTEAEIAIEALATADA